MVCNACGKEFSDSFGFCPFCGTKAVKKQFCIKCGAELVEGAAFCGVCGNKIGGQAAAVKKFDPRGQVKQKVWLSDFDSEDEPENAEAFTYKGKEYTVWFLDNDEIAPLPVTSVVSSELEVFDSVEGEFGGLTVYNGRLYASVLYYCEKDGQTYTNALRCISDHVDIINVGKENIRQTVKINGNVYVGFGDGGVANINGKILLQPKKLRNMAHSEWGGEYQILRPGDAGGRVLSVNASLIGNGFVMTDDICHEWHAYYFVITPDGEISSGPYWLGGYGNMGDYNFKPVKK